MNTPKFQELCRYLQAEIRDGKMSDDQKLKMVKVILPQSQEFNDGEVGIYTGIIKNEDDESEEDE